MPQEIEVKLKVDTHDGIRRQLQQLGGSPRGTVRETNIFFDRNGGELRARDQGLRVRFSARHAAIADTLLTFKGPAATTGLRTREAFDLHITPGTQLVPLLQALGFEQVLLFEKDRETWELDRCLVELDTLPHFGTFLEIEGPSELLVYDVQRKLGLGECEPHRMSYSRMVGEYTQGRGTAELRF